MKSGQRPLLVLVQLLGLSAVIGLVLVTPLFYVHDHASDVLPSALLVSANVWAGSLLWTLTRRRPATITEVLGVGVASAFIAPSLLLLLTPVGLPVIADWLVLPIVAAAVALRRVLARGFTPRLDYSMPTWVGAGIAMVAAMVLNRHWLELYRTANIADPQGFHPDMFAIQAIVQANPSEGLGQMGMMADWPMRYHWLSYGWAGSLESATNATSFFTVAQLMPLLAIMGTALLVASVASRLSRRRWVPCVSALIVICGHQIGDSSGLVINWESPSQSVSTVGLLFGLLLLLEFRRSSHVIVASAAIGIVVFATTGFKFSAGVVLIAAIVGFIAVSIKRGDSVLHNAGILLGGVCGLVAFWTLFQSGQETGGILIPRHATVTALLEPSTWLSSSSELKTAAWRTAAVIPGWAGLIYIFFKRWRRCQPIVIAGILMGAAGILPLWVFQEIAPTSTFFLASACAGIAAISVYAAAQLLKARTPRETRALLFVSLSVSLVSVGIWGVVASSLAESTLVLPSFFIFVIFSVSVLGALLLRLYSTDRLGSLIVAILIISSTVSPLAMPIIERGLGSQVPMVAPRKATEDAIQSVTTPVTHTGGIPVASLHGQFPEGAIVAFVDDGLLPSTLTESLRPYVSWPAWVTLDGPVGTTREYDRRLEITRKALEGDTAAKRSLCLAGVDALVSVAQDVPGLRVESLDTACLAS